MPIIAILAGEPSGDLIASQLMKYLNTRFKNVEYIGIGGPLMSKQGLNSFFDYGHLGVRGYFQVLRHLPKLLYLRLKLIRYLKKHKPNIFIGIDAPDFNFYLEKQLKKFGIPTFHYVAPAVWAWRKNRIYTIKKCIDHLFAVFPHEPKLFKKGKISISYVGHPLANKISLNPNLTLSRKKLHIKNKVRVFALLPGSRIGELRWHMSLMLNTALLLNKTFSNIIFLMPINNKENYEYAMQCLSLIPVNNLKLIIGHSDEVICSSNFSIVASGTASLEAALYKKPMIVTYRGSVVSYLIWKIVRLTPFVALPNILLEKSIVPELLQQDATPESIANKVIEILNDKVYLQKLSKEYLLLHKKLKRNTSELIFKKIVKYLK
ncbi:MAG: lipid-A-disaccharide synthase [Methylophilaceae bacterium]